MSSSPNLLVGEHRAELAPDGRVGEVSIGEKQALEGELLRVRDPATQAEPLGDARRVDEIGVGRSQGFDAFDRA